MTKQEILNKLAKIQEELVVSRKALSTASSNTKKLIKQENECYKELFELDKGQSTPAKK